MQIKIVFILLIIGTIYLHESQAGKIALIKAKLAVAKVPHVLATAAVAKEVKIKSKVAALKTWDALKAKKDAAISVITAPFRIAKKKIALKIGAFKALKALKLAKIAKTAVILKNLKKSPIILPVPVALPVGAKTLPSLPSLPQLPALPQFPEIPNFLNIPPPSLGESLGPIQGFISGAQKVLQTAGGPLLSQLTGTIGAPTSSIPKEVTPVVAAAATPAAVYRFVPEAGFTKYNKVSYEPKLDIEVSNEPTSN